MGNSGQLVALGLLLACGCAHQARHGSAADLPTEVQAARVLPMAAKNRVHVAFVAGPVDLAGLNRLRAEAIDLGFIKTYAGCVGQKAGLLEALRASLRKEPDARFAFIGGGTGAALAADLAQEMRAEGATVDLVAYVGATGTPPEAEGHFLRLPAKDPTTRTTLLRELAESASRVRVMDRAALPPGLRGEWDLLKPDGPCPEVPCGRPTLEAASCAAGR